MDAGENANRDSFNHEDIGGTVIKLVADMGELKGKFEVLLDQFKVIQKQMWYLIGAAVVGPLVADILTGRIHF